MVICILGNIAKNVTCACLRIMTKCNKLLLLVNMLEGDREELQVNTVVSK